MSFSLFINFRKNIFSTTPSHTNLYSYVPRSWCYLLANLFFNYSAQMLFLKEAFLGPSSQNQTISPIFFTFLSKFYFITGNMSSTVCFSEGHSTQNRFTYVYQIELKFILWKIRTLVWNENRILECIQKLTEFL